MEVNFKEGMMDMAWAEQLSVGNAVLDSDHKKLMSLVNDIDSLAKGKDSFELSRTLKLFKSCMNRHSINEEQFAQVLDFPFGLHKLAHQNMQTAIDLTEYELGKNSVAPTIFVMKHYPKFLRDWLIKHIAEEDMLMKPALQTYPYDFKIGEVYAWIHAGHTCTELPPAKAGELAQSGATTKVVNRTCLSAHESTHEDQGHRLKPVVFTKCVDNKVAALQRPSR